jgi:hypothetical protein
VRFLLLQGLGCSTTCEENCIPRRRGYCPSRCVFCTLKVVVAPPPARKTAYLAGEVSFKVRFLHLEGLGCSTTCEENCIPRRRGCPSRCAFCTLKVVGRPTPARKTTYLAGEGTVLQGAFCSLKVLVFALSRSLGYNSR